jgi:hypothetical protein
MNIRGSILATGALIGALALASRDAPSGCKCVAKHFHDHKNIMATSLDVGNSWRARQPAKK